MYAGLNQRTGELMAVKVLELVAKHKAGTQGMALGQLQELQQVCAGGVGGGGEGGGCRCTMHWLRGRGCGRGGCLHRTRLVAARVVAHVRSGAAAPARPSLQELELYKKLQHPHVVTYIDHHFDKACSTLYIFLEYVPGGSIASMLDRWVLLQHVRMCARCCSAQRNSAAPQK